MRQITGVFTQGSNRRHGRTGHLFQGRYQAILVDSDRYLQQRGDVGDEVQIPKPQRRGPPPTLPQIRQAAGSRDGAIIVAYGTGGFSFAEIGAFFGLHFTTAARIVRKARQPTGGPGRASVLQI